MFQKYINQCDEIIEYYKQVKTMSKIPDSFKGISHQIQSELSSRQQKGQKIPPHVLDKYLKIGNKTLMDQIDKAIQKIRPVWAITLTQFSANVRGVISSDWPFSQQNKSIYLAVWGPLSLVLFCYLLHNSPFENKFMILTTGFIDISLILLLGFLCFVYSNILKFPFNQFLHHLSIASYINILTIVHCCISTGSSSGVIIGSSILYVGGCSYLHFNLYNKAIKPTLLQFVTLMTLLCGVYISSAIIFYQNFGEKEKIVLPHISDRIRNHLGSRKFECLDEKLI